MPKPLTFILNCVIKVQSVNLSFSLSVSLLFVLSLFHICFVCLFVCSFFLFSFFRSLLYSFFPSLFLHCCYNLYRHHPFFPSSLLLFTHCADMSVRVQVCNHHCRPRIDTNLYLSSMMSKNDNALVAQQSVEDQEQRESG